MVWNISTPLPTKRERGLASNLVANYRYAPCLGECGGGILLTVGEGEQIACLDR
jgi:hypothetical protein